MSAASDLFTAVFDKMEIRTAATGSMVVNLRGPPDPQNRAILEKLKPTVIFTGPGGAYYQIAPYGAASGAVDPELATAGKFGAAGLALGLVGAFFLIRYL